MNPAKAGVAYVAPTKALTSQITRRLGVILNKLESQVEHLTGAIGLMLLKKIF
jgi:superfamily II RNA helicase